MIDFKRLSDPFPPEAVSWRVGSTTQDKTRGLPLAYIDARDVMDRLDEVCGLAGWQCRYAQSDKDRTICEIGVLCDGGWVWKADGADDTDYEGVKGGLSDAFKRAAVRWGVGRYLYGLGSPWVSIKQAGRSYKIDESEMPRLRSLLPSPDGKKDVVSLPVVTKDKSRPLDIPIHASMEKDGRFAPYTKVTPAGKMWKVMAIKEDAWKISEDLKGITDIDNLTGFRGDNETTLTAMAEALPAWSRAFEEAYAQRAREIEAVEKSWSKV